MVQRFGIAPEAVECPAEIGMEHVRARIVLQCLFKHGDRFIEPVKVGQRRALDVVSRPVPRIRRDRFFTGGKTPSASRALRRNSAMFGSASPQRVPGSRAICSQTASASRGRFIAANPAIMLR